MCDVEALGTVLRESELPALAVLGSLFDALIEDLGDVSDAIYLADPRWAAIVEAASRAKAAMDAS